MSDRLTDALPPPQRIACAWAGRGLEAATAGLLLLDNHCAGLVRHSREPRLAQIRLAWWREMLAQPAQARPRSDPLIATLEAWNGHEDALVELVAGWEHLLGEVPLPVSAFVAFAEGRAEAAAGLARLAAVPHCAEAARSAARRWALADLACHLTDETERSSVLALAAQQGTARIPLARSLRPLAVLNGLAIRALRRGGGALISGRADVLAALRLGMTGR